ncbi:MAG TPA: MMPL family transporter, partial [Thermoleophilaceae bacterium]
MQRAMDRLSGWVERHRRMVVALWAVALVAAIPFSLKQTDHLTSGGFDVPGSGAQRADAELHRFPGVHRDRLEAVFELEDGAGAAQVRSAAARLRREARGISHLSIPVAAAGADARQPRIQRAGDRRVAIVPLALTGSEDQNADAASDLRHRLDVGDGARHGVETHLVGQQALWAGMQDLSKKDLASAEKAGFPIVLVILLAVFGSLAAAALPLALGIGSVTLTGAAIWGLSQATEMSVFVTNVASMIGIGVAVDYSLFVLARYREEIQGGAAPDDARRTAMRTSGIAVAFSGVTVLISLGGLFLVDSTTIRSMAMGAIVVVAVSILGAITLLPALMSILGRRAYARSRVATITGLLVRAWRSAPRRRGRSHPDHPRPAFWQRWTERTMRRPVLVATLTAAVLLTLAYPALSLEWGDGALR